jgi:hypothetical protein
VKLEKVAQKIIELMSDNRIHLSDWKYDIPMYIAQQDLPILANAKNLADGIDYAMERYGIDLPEDIVVAYSGDKQTMVGGKVRNGQ